MTVKTIHSNDSILGSGIILLIEHVLDTVHLEEVISMKRQQMIHIREGNSNEETVTEGFFSYILNFCNNVLLI